MPGGVNSPVRAFKSVGGDPVFFARAGGARVGDEDGNELVDWCMSWGPLILGHAHEAVVRAVTEAASRGLSYGACHAAEAELAERVVGAIEGVDRVRMVSSGTEAVMTALRIARGYTGRTALIKFDGGYHGHSDALLVKAGSGLATFGTSSSSGVPESFAAETIVLPFDDEEALEEAFARHGSRVACAVVEPLPANTGLLVQRREWLERLRTLTREHGALLVFDEVITGFRLRYGAYGEMVGVRPDLVTLGKIVGGGMPVGAVAGPGELMELLSPEGDVYQAGTLAGNPVAMAAGIATLDALRDGRAYEALERVGRAFEDAVAAAQRPWLQARRVGSLVWVYLDEGALPVRADAISADAVERFNAVHGDLLEDGHYLPPSGFEVLFLSTAHTERDVRDLVDALVRRTEARL
jgi:glutamate-1-semialdehyde 2,1-aminomutase